MATSVLARVLSTASVLALALAGCGADQCLRHSDCPSQRVCTTAGRCEVPPAPDAAPVIDDSDPIQPLPDGAFDESDMGDPSDAGADPVDAEDGI